MSYARMVTINWLALLLAMVYSCQAHSGYAGELVLDLSAGASKFLVTSASGDYRQNLPADFDTDGLAYRVGLCWKFNEKWQSCGAWLNLGSLKQDALFVDDRDYNPKTGQVTTAYGAPVPNKITDSYKGVELTLTRTFPLTQAISWHLKAGGAYLEHKMTVTRMDLGIAHQAYGQFPSIVAGAGVSYKWLYTEAIYYHGLGGSNGFMGQDQGWPLSKEMIVAWAGLKVPIW